MATSGDSRLTFAAAADRKVDFMVQLLQHQSEERSKQSFTHFVRNLLDIQLNIQNGNFLFLFPESPRVLLSL